jgi:hypothetical protein
VGKTVIMHALSQRIASDAIHPLLAPGPCHAPI